MGRISFLRTGVQAVQGDYAQNSLGTEVREFFTKSLGLPGPLGRALTFRVL